MALPASRPSSCLSIRNRRDVRDAKGSSLLCPGSYPTRTNSHPLSCRAEKRAKFSRRRAEYHDADISYINERNRDFNKKLDRFYGKVTQGIRDNLERGTAI